MPRATLNAEQLAKKRGVRGVALRNFLRAHPELAPRPKGHRHYRIDAKTEARIVAHPGFADLPRRADTGR
jgi:hypothetical protein